MLVGAFEQEAAGEKKKVGGGGVISIYLVRAHQKKKARIICILL